MVGPCHPNSISAGRVASLSFQNPIHPTRPWYIIFNALRFSVFSFFLNLKALSHSLNISNMCRSTLISQYRQALNLHHRRSVPSSQPPSSSIYADLSTSIITDFRFSSIHHRRSAISAIHHLWSASQGCCFQLFSLYFFVSVSCKSSFYLCSLDLWVTGVWVCRSILQCRFVF